MAAGAYGGYFEGLAGFSDRPRILGRGDAHENLSVTLVGGQCVRIRVGSHCFRRLACTWLSVVGSDEFRDRSEDRQGD